MSVFVECLKEMLDCGLFSREEWAWILFGAKKHVNRIEEWINEDTVPADYSLNMIVTTLNLSSDVPKDILERFKKMAQLPARKVSKHGSLMLPTVWEYMKRPIFSDLSSKLAKLNSIQEKKDLLESLYPEERN
jgi:hypothetical protein